MGTAPDQVKLRRFHHPRRFVWLFAAPQSVDNARLQHSSEVLMGSLIVAGMLSHQLKQHVIDGEKTIIQNPTDQQK